MKRGIILILAACALSALTGFKNIGRESSTTSATASSVSRAAANGLLYEPGYIDNGGDEGERLAALYLSEIMRNMISGDWDVNRCAYKGIELYGKVKVVESFPDLKVQIVDSFPDIDVQVVTSFPDKCGKWQFVESFPDFKIQFVTSFPDIKIRYVTSFPGLK